MPYFWHRSQGRPSSHLLHAAAQLVHAILTCFRFGLVKAGGAPTGAPGGPGADLVKTCVISYVSRKVTLPLGGCKCVHHPWMKWNHIGWWRRDAIRTILTMTTILRWCVGKERGWIGTWWWWCRIRGTIERRVVRWRICLFLVSGCCFAGLLASRHPAPRCCDQRKLRMRRGGDRIRLLPDMPRPLSATMLR